MKIKPIGDRLIIRLLKAEEKTVAGIILPGASKEPPQLAEVVEIGSGVEEGTVNIGDKVVYSKYAGTEVKIDDEELTIIKASEISAIVG